MSGSASEKPVGVLQQLGEVIFTVDGRRLG